MRGIILSGLTSVPPMQPAVVGSLRFFGDITDDDGRIKSSVQGESNSLNIGNTDFTVEFWAIVEAANTTAAITAGPNVNWTTGNIIYDRDVFGTDVAGFGACFGDGRFCWGLNVAGGSSRTIVGTTDVRGAPWHHFALQRRASDGLMTLHVDGVLEASFTGPTGSLQYPDSHSPQVLCGPGANLLCDFSDPFQVIGTEKHDANAAGFNGWATEVRVSATLRYPTAGNFTPATQPFATDGHTRQLLHMGEGSGNTVGDSSGLGNHATRKPNASAQPVWSALKPFT